MTTSHVPEIAEDVVRGYLDDLRNATTEVNDHDIASLVGEIADAVAAGRNILIAGNGGSAMTASHMAGDLSACLVRARSSSFVTALADNVARLTAIANDV